MNTNETTETTDLRTNELTDEEIQNLVHDDPAYKEWYAKLLSDIKDILTSEEIASLYYRYQMGKAILKARNEWLKTHPAADKKGVTDGVMNDLRKDLQYSRAILYDCLRFADPPKKGYQKFRYKNLDEFGEHRWEVKRTDSTGVESTLKVRGKDLTWTEVRTQVIRNKHRTEPDSEQTEGESAEPKTVIEASPPATPTLAIIAPLLPLGAPATDEYYQVNIPFELGKRFFEAAQNANKLPVDVLSEFIRDFIDSHQGTNQAK